MMMSRSETVQVRPENYATRKERPFAKRRKGKKGGRLFFPILIFLSGFVVLFLSICTFYQKDVGFFLLEQIVIERGFIPLLSQSYGLEERMEIRQKLSRFYALAKNGKLEDEDINRVSDRLQKIMADQRLEKEEVKSLLSLISSHS